jgi:DNA-binding CsgD family transcriptional regulator
MSVRRGACDHRSMDAASILREVLEPAATGTPTVVVVEAGPGTGKTSLCREAAARADGWLVLSSTANESEVGYPLVVLSEILPALAGQVGRLQELLARAAIADALVGEPDPLVLGTALSKLLAAASRERPVLIVIDDCEWCDPLSGQVLRLALRRASGGRVSALLTYGTGTVGALPVRSVRWQLGAIDGAAITPPGCSAACPSGASAPRVQVLSPKELEVCLAVADGKTTRQAAAALFVSPKTIEFHLTHAYRKLGVANRAQLARLAAEGRFTTLPAW